MANAINIEVLSRQELTELLARVLTRLLMPELTDQVQEREPTEATAQLLTAKQVAALWNVPETWIRDQARAGKLHSVQLGRYVRFRLPDIESFLNAKPEPTRLTFHRNGIQRV